MALDDPSNPSPEIPAPVCVKCAGAMQEGFIPDNTYGEVMQSAWVAGRAETGWFGKKVDGKETYPIRTFRCTQCGYLESYASSQ
jgi:hypothetical protein